MNRERLFSTGPDIVETLMANVCRMRFREYKNCATMDLSPFLPKASKSLGTNLYKTVLSQTIPRLLILEGHLYLDHILTRHLERLPMSRRRIERMRFIDKLMHIKNGGSLFSATADCIEKINRLRNEFVHDLFFDLSSWNPKTVEWLAPITIKVPRVRLYRTYQNVVIFRILMLGLLFDLSHQWQWLFLENIPSKRRPRPSK